MNIKEYIETLPLVNGSFRGDCIKCGNKNTFIVNTVNGELLFYCFHASCNLKGKTNAELSIDVLRDMGDQLLNNVFSPDNLYGGQRDIEAYISPEYFTGALQNHDCYKFLSRYNLLSYYERNVDRIRYDPKLHRCVFILKDYDNVCMGAVGRSLSYSNLPRWYVYHRECGTPFIVVLRSPLEKAILVEDCVSAVTGSTITNSIALLGTNIPSECITYLLPFHKLYIALDADATGKALKLQKELSFYRETNIIPLKKDLKYFTNDELLELQKEYLN